eukprot:9677790-Alexandrium_andersonii.AAC.1
MTPPDADAREDDVNAALPLPGLPASVPLLLLSTIALPNASAVTEVRLSSTVSSVTSHWSLPPSL